MKKKFLSTISFLYLIFSSSFLISSQKKQLIEDYIKGGYNKSKLDGIVQKLTDDEWNKFKPIYSNNNHENIKQYLQNLLNTLAVEKVVQKEIKQTQQIVQDITQINQPQKQNQLVDQKKKDKEKKIDKKNIENFFSSLNTQAISAQNSNATQFATAALKNGDQGYQKALMQCGIPTKELLSWYKTSHGNNDIDKFLNWFDKQSQAMAINTISQPSKILGKFGNSDVGNFETEVAEFEEFLRSLEQKENKKSNKSCKNLKTKFRK